MHVRRSESLRQIDPVNPVGCDSPFARINQSLQELQKIIEQTTEPGTRTEIQRIADSLDEASRKAACNQERILTQSLTLSLAHANSKILSAEVIELLESTRKELAETKLLADRPQNERLKLLLRVFNHSREGVVILNRDATIEEVNPAFAQISSCPESELVGRPLHETLKWTFPAYSTVFHAVLSGQPWSGRVVIAKTDTEERSWLISLSPVENGSQPSHVMVLFSDVTDIERTQKRLKRQALHDQLTGLPNRRFYRDRLRAMIDEYRLRRYQFAVCFIDLDDFKVVNDSLGHSAGDELLIRVGQRLRTGSGTELFVARFGGDEFAILIPRCDDDPTLIASVADDILRTLRDPIHLGDAEVRISASLGISVYPADGETADELMQNADIAMYAAKRDGHDQVRMFSPVMRHRVERRNRIQRELHHAIQSNDISVQYQPLLNLRTGEMTSCEALARWRTTGGDQISPAEFIPVAEQSGLVSHLGDVILSTVCRQLVQWNDRGIRPNRSAINLSARQLRSPGFVQRVKEILDREGASPDWFTFEVTETAIMEDSANGIQLLDQLSRLGITLALDDFGTGQSSLSYLRNLSIHFLKIDRSFVNDLPADERAVAIVDSVIRLGQSRGLRIVAEGIETHRQLDTLSDMGCDFGQGYLIAHPLSSDEFEYRLLHDQFKLCASAP
ncbi:MAG: EAL domain-containing protein [Planctomyces sp.]|nr:EAL domain-containing protein [Planctomyces sp.]